MNKPCVLEGSLPVIGQILLQSQNCPYFSLPLYLSLSLVRLAGTHSVYLQSKNWEMQTESGGERQCDPEWAREEG